MTFLVYLCFLLWVTVVGFTIWGTLLALKLIKKDQTEGDLRFESGVTYRPPVSILKPLKNLENGVSECVESFFRLDYPKYELIFCFTSEADPGYPLIQEFICNYPSVDAKVLVGEGKIGFNPKIDNLIKGYQQAKYDWVLISDGNVLAKPHYLSKLVTAISPGVGLITSNIKGLNPKSLGGRLESLILNTHFTRWNAVLNAFRFPAISGKAMLFQKSVASRFGGLASLANYLAEDFIFGEKVRALGMRVVLTTEMVHQNIGDQSVHSYWDRHLRWGRIRKSLSPFGFIVEILINSFISGLLGAWALNHRFGLSPLIFLSIHLCMWLILDLVLVQAIEGGIFIGDPLIWLARELSVFPQWVAVGTSNGVNWRGQSFRIGSQTQLAPLEYGDLSEGFDASLSLGGSHQ